MRGWEWREIRVRSSSRPLSLGKAVVVSRKLGIKDGPSVDSVGLHRVSNGEVILSAPFYDFCLCLCLYNGEVIQMKVSKQHFEFNLRKLLMDLPNKKIENELVSD
jgi:hypothetical protein